ncbi:MAG: acyl-CoA thioesterase [Planctomycetes bacterium]|nr:acyl-CoA thioesterase [Planctomycetota bacterium]
MDFPKRVIIKSHTITIIPRYNETDQAGVVHHSVYPVWFELGRTELLRVNGLAYKKLEEAGVYFVVAEFHVKFRQPTKYDEELQLVTECSSVTASKIKHSYTLSRRGDGVVVAEGTSVLACINGEGKVRRIPDFMYSEAEKTIV